MHLLTFICAYWKTEEVYLPSRFSLVPIGGHSHYLNPSTLKFYVILTLAAFQWA